MFFFIMRHGQAEPSAASDRARRLTPAGVREVTDVARAMLASTGGVQRVICSPFDRARETAEIMLAGLGLPEVRLEAADAIISGGDVSGALHWLQSTVDGDTLIVSHVPLVSELSSVLLHGHPEHSFPYRPASIHALQVEAFAPGGAEELWFRGPQDWSPA